MVINQAREQGQKKSERKARVSFTKMALGLLGGAFFATSSLVDFIWADASHKDREKQGKQEKATKEFQNRPFVDLKGMANTMPFADFTAVAESVMGSVVSIVAQQQSKSSEDDLFKKFQGTPFEDFFKKIPEMKSRKVMVGGSGFFVRMDKDYAFIATNSHIVKDTTKIYILLGDKTEVPAELHGMDTRSDLAVLRVKLSDVSDEKRQKIRPLEWGDSEGAKVGQWVMAIGNPFGLGDTVTVGIISAKSRDLRTGGNALTDDFIQHSAPINQGNSGGCLVSMDGRVIGINTVIITPSGGNVGIGFAIPSKSAQHVIEQLIEKKKVRRGALGVKVQDFTKEMAESMGKSYKGGAAICWIDPDGPAAKSGLKVGDAIVQFDDVEIVNIKALTHIVSDARVDSVHKVKVLRNGKELVIEVKLGDFDNVDSFKDDREEGSHEESSNKGQKPIQILGMSLIDVSKARKSGMEDLPRLSDKWNGALILKIQPDSAADDKGLMRGDIIEEVNQKKIATAEDFRRLAVEAVKEGHKHLFIGIRRDNVVLYLALPISQETLFSEGSQAEEKENKTEKAQEKEQTGDQEKEQGAENKKEKEEKFSFGFKKKKQDGVQNFKDVIEGFFGRNFDGMFFFGEKGKQKN